MVEEIVSRYVAAQPKPPKRKKWPYVLAAILLCCAGINLSSRLDQLDSRYNNLQNSIGNISSGVNAQIGSITNRVEEILKAQNHLTADYSCEVLSADLRNNTVTFSVRVVPKTYVEGMEVYFQADGGPGPTVLAASQDGSVFTGEMTCELTDSITVSAVLVTGETRQTQLLDSFSGLYSASLPYLYLSGLETALMHTERRSDGTFLLPECWGWIRGMEEETKFGPVAIQDIRVGLFLNYRPVAWLTPTETPEHWELMEDDEVYFLPETPIQPEQGDILHFAAIYTDEYGRTGVASCIPAFECMGDEISWMQSSDATSFSEIENYIL